MGELLRNPSPTGSIFPMKIPYYISFKNQSSAGQGFSFIVLFLDLSMRMYHENTQYQ